MGFNLDRLVQTLAGGGAGWLQGQQEANKQRLLDEESKQRAQQLEMQRQNMASEAASRDQNSQLDALKTLTAARAQQASQANNEHDNALQTAQSVTPGTDVRQMPDFMAMVDQQIKAGTPVNALFKSTPATTNVAPGASMSLPGSVDLQGQPVAPAQVPASTVDFTLPKMEKIATPEQQQVLDKAAHDKLRETILGQIQAQMAKDPSTKLTPAMRLQLAQNNINPAEVEPSSPERNPMPVQLPNGQSAFAVPQDGKMVEVPGAKPIPPAQAANAAAAPAAGEGFGTFTGPGLDYAATRARITGKIDGRDSKMIGAINSRIAEQVKSLGSSPAQALQQQAFRQSDQKALDRATLAMTSAEGFENKAIPQGDLVVKLSNEVGRSAIPLLNKAIVLPWKDQIMGDPKTQNLFNAITTFATEYAKIMEGSTGSAAAASVGAMNAAQRLINAAQTPAGIEATVKQMKYEMDLTKQGWKAVIEDVGGRMRGAEPAPQGGATQPANAPPPKAPKDTPMDQRVAGVTTALLPNGKIGTWDGQGGWVVK